MKRPSFHIKSSEWKRMPPKTKAAIVEMIETLHKNVAANKPWLKRVLADAKRRYKQLPKWAKEEK